MRFLKTAYCFLFVLFLTSFTNAQQSNAKTLLWRISGKNLHEPSYLFGTMHLSDKRLFRFSDSVYKAIEGTEGLAIEVNPDEMIAYYVNRMFDEIQSHKKLSDLLDKEDYNKYKNYLSKKFRKPADEITANDVVQEKNKWMVDYMKKGEMPTFVDAYLYNMAKKQGKWIGGIEDITDQAGLMEDLVDKSDIESLIATGDATAKGETSKLLEQMIKMYTEEDIYAIEKITSGQSQKMKDQLLLKRNIKMARRMDSLMNFRKMFFAVGVAHLPGEGGVIDLLRKNGFTVEPVVCKTKLDASNYKFKEVEIPWVEVKDEQNLYHVSMPGNPVDVKLFGLINMKFQFDLSTFTGFYTMAVVSPSEFTNPDSIYNITAERMFKNGHFDKPKNVTRGNVTGKEYTQPIDDAVMRIQLFAVDRVLYAAAVYSIKKESVQSADADKFLRSFTPHELKTDSNTNGYAFVDSIMGIRFSSPAQLTYNKQFSSDNVGAWKVTAYSGSDLSTGAYVLLFSKEVKPGSYIENDSLLFDEYYQKLRETYAGLKKKDTTWQGFPAYLYYGNNLGEEKTSMKILCTIRGDRNIVLMVVGSSSYFDKHLDDKVFASFQFLPYKKTEWYSYSSQDGSFSTKAPSSFKKISEETISHFSTYHVAYDTITSSSYFVFTDTLNKYYWAENDSIFWNTQINNLKAFDDSILSLLPITAGDLQGRQVVFKNNRTNKLRKIKLVLNGDVVYIVLTRGTEEVLNRENAKKFFDDFRVAVPSSGFDILQSKSVKLLNDLSSNDSLTRAEAVDAVSKPEFSRSDIPLLHNAILKQYQPIYIWGSGTYINNELAGKLETLEDASTVEFATKNYHTLINDTISFQPIALRILSGIQTKESYDKLGELIRQSPPKESINPYQFTKSLNLTRTIFPSLATLAKDSVSGTAIANITMALLDSGKLQKEDVLPYAADFYILAQNLLPSLKSKSFTDYNIYSLIRLLGYFNTKESNIGLQNFLQSSGIYITESAAIELLRNGEIVDTATINRLASEFEVRADFYDSLKQMKKADLFPKKYLTQKSFAESLIYSIASDEYDVLDVKFLTEKTSKYNDTVYKFYLFKVVLEYDGSTENYLGIAGGYATDSKDLKPKKNLSWIVWDEELDSNNMNEIFEKGMNELDKTDNGAEE